MHVRDINRSLFELPSHHPARVFLEAFIECRESCVGLELPAPVGCDLDQQWWSDKEGKSCKFSSFAYSYLSVDIELDGWLSGSAHQTESEISMLARIRHMHSLMAECRRAAIANDNDEIVQAVDEVQGMLDLWKECIDVRLAL